MKEKEEGRLQQGILSESDKTDSAFEALNSRRATNIAMCSGPFENRAGLHNRLAERELWHEQKEVTIQDSSSILYGQIVLNRMCYQYGESEQFFFYFLFFFLLMIELLLCFRL